MLLDVLFVKIRYQCEHCASELQSLDVCRSGCNIRDPKLILLSTCLVQDGTAKATLELKNTMV